MVALEIQPWGRSPTPLVPLSLAEELDHIPAPSSISDVLGVRSTLGDLNSRIWEHLDTVGPEVLKDIVELTRPQLASLTHLTIRSGEPLHRPVQDLPFSNRTRNCVARHLEKFAQRRLTFGEVMSIPSIGARGAIEFACVVEAAMMSASDTLDTSRPQTLSKASSTPHEIESAFQTLAAYAAGERNQETLAGVLPDAPNDWPPEIKQLWGSIAQVGTRQIAGELTKRYAVPELLSRALAPLDDRLVEIITERVIVLKSPTTLELLGDRMGITRERVRQLEKKAITHLERISNREFRPVIRRARAVRARLGSGVPVDARAVQETLDWATEDISRDTNISGDFAGSLLLWLAGPYEVRKGWLLAQRDLKNLTLEAILDRRGGQGMVPHAAISEVLTQFELNQAVQKSWLERLGDFVAVDGGYIYFRGSILQKVRTLLRFYNRPLSVEEMIEMLGSGSIRSVRQRLIDDPGFWRINKQSEFVIAGTPGYDEYTGITDEIVQEIEACGGEAHFDHLIAKLTSVYGVKENSVVAYISTPMFTKDKAGMVRVRDTELPIDVVTDITKTASCYQRPDGSWLWRVLVDKDIVRGSGKLVPNAFAQEVGCSLGDKIEVDTTEGPLTFSWPLTSTTGASIGSLRSAIESCEAELGDYVFVCATKLRITFERLAKQTLDTVNSDKERLCLLMGVGDVSNDEDVAQRIETALGVLDGSGDSPVDLRRLLNARGESDLASMIPAETLSMDEYVANMSKLFER